MAADESREHGRSSVLGSSFEDQTMTTTLSSTGVGGGISLPIANQPMEAILQAERERLMKEAGLNIGPVKHFHRPQERPFTKAEREKVTILLGGLTLRHDKLL